MAKKERMPDEAIYQMADEYFNRVQQLLRKNLKAHGSILNHYRMVQASRFGYDETSIPSEVLDPAEFLERSRSAGDN